jgi:hypothetical protein
LPVCGILGALPMGKGKRQGLTPLTLPLTLTPILHWFFKQGRFFDELRFA